MDICMLSGTLVSIRDTYYKYFGLESSSSSTILEYGATDRLEYHAEQRTFLEPVHHRITHPPRREGCPFRWPLFNVFIKSESRISVVGAFASSSY